MSSDKTPMLAQVKAGSFLGGVASGCGCALNSIMVALGDRFGLYKTGQYRTDLADSEPRPTTLQIPTGAQPSPPALRRQRRPASVVSPGQADGA